MDFYDVFPTLRPGYWYGNYDEHKWNEYKFFHDGLGSTLTLGFTRDLIDNDIQASRNAAYMKRYGLSYDDIVDPTKLSGMDIYARGFDWVSSNIKRLYRK